MYQYRIWYVSLLQSLDVIFRMHAIFFLKKSAYNQATEMWRLVLWDVMPCSLAIILPFWRNLPLQIRRVSLNTQSMNVSSGKTGIMLPTKAASQRLYSLLWELCYLRTHARIPAAVMTLPEYNVSHARYRNKDLLVCGWRPIQRIAVHIQMRVDKWPQWHCLLQHAFCCPLPVTACEQ
jgi:hypothetical protein